MDETKENQTDFYQILGLSQDASYDDIYKKYLKLSLKYHPDKDGDTEKYEQVILAYKVLKNPKNRKKYNESLATTFNQFKDENRDTTYHVNEEYLLKNDETEKKEFNLDKFLNNFERTRNQFEETKQIQTDVEHPKRNLEDLLKDRDNDLTNFQVNQKTNLFNPKQNLENFNYVFGQYKSLNSNELEEYQNLDPENTYASVKHDTIDTLKINQDIEKIIESTNNLNYIPVVTSQPKDDPCTLNKKIDQYKQETVILEELESEDFIKNTDDTPSDCIPDQYSNKSSSNSDQSSIA